MFLSIKKVIKILSIINKNTFFILIINNSVRSLRLKKINFCVKKYIFEEKFNNFMLFKHQLYIKKLNKNKNINF